MGQATETIKGTVLDENNEPVIGASVTLKGQTKGVSTDAFGNFAISAVPGAQLTVTYVGYKTETVRAAQGMTVYLQPTTEILDQLVVVGYGQQKKADLTGAVATVDVSRVMDNRSSGDVTKMLQGAVPGLTIINASGEIGGDLGNSGASSTINIRGLGTLSNGHTSAPLIVVDGVPVDNLDFINPEDIEDISVLKDAASASIYGSRAAFGVILVTTKSANRADRVSVKYTNNFGWGNATMLPTQNGTVENLLVAMDNTNTGGDTEIFGMYYTDLLPFAQLWRQQHGGKQYTGLVNLQPFQNAGNVGDYYIFPANSQFPEGVGTGQMLSARYLSYADWDVKKTLFHSAFSQKHNVSLEGVSGKTNYRLSFGYDEREGLMRYNPEKSRRYNANANIDTQIFSWLKAGARINFSQSDFSMPNVQRNSYQYIWRWPSFYENYGYATYDGVTQGFRNDAFIRMTSQEDKTVNNTLRLQAYMDATIIKGLTLHADYTYALNNRTNEYSAVPLSLWDTWSPGANRFATWTNWSQATSYVNDWSRRNYTWTANIFATYAKTFADAHNLKVMLGWTAEKEDFRQFNVRRTGLTDYNLPNLNLTNGETYTTSANYWHRATTGFFGRINYDYKGRYLLEVNGRYDGSSRFPAADQWAFFPSFSAGWRISEEDFFKGVKSWWSNAKIRGSYGTVGNEAVGSNMFLSTASAVAAGSVYWLNGTQKMTMFQMPSLVSQTLTWERIETGDVGVDLGFLNNSLNVTFDWFNRDTKDMLSRGATLPQVLGASAPYQNTGQLRTQGWELGVNFNKSFGEADFYATFTLADARSKVVKWTGNDTGILYTYLPSGSSYYEGQYFGDIWGFETDRYFTVDDFNGQNPDGSWNYKQGVADQTGLQSGSFRFGPGDVKYKDLNGDGKIDGGAGTLEDHGDLKVIGNAMPRFEYGIRLGGAWKGFDADIFFQGVGKRDMWATGSTIVPMSQSGLGTFTNQWNNYNTVEYDSNGMFVGANIDQNNMYPRMYSGAGAGGKVGNIGNGTWNFYPQSRYLVNMAYCRVKNLTIGYTLPTQITQKALIQKARLYFTAENLGFIYNGAKKYQLDPELATASGSGTIGADGGAGLGTFGRVAPMQQTFSFGVQVTL